MAHTYAEALQRASELNKTLKGSCKFARPCKDTEHPHLWNVEIVDTKVLMKQHEAGKPYDGDDVPYNGVL